MTDPHGRDQWVFAFLCLVWRFFIANLMEPLHPLSSWPYMPLWSSTETGSCWKIVAIHELADRAMRRQCSSVWMRRMIDGPD